MANREALLTNIFKEIKDPAGVRQSVLYRNERYFERLTSGQEYGSSFKTDQRNAISTTGIL